MAYYDALIAEWPTVIAALPAGTTQQRLDYVNALTVTGSIPSLFDVSPAALLNCLNVAEFLGLTAAQQTNLLTLLSAQGPLKGGSASFVGLLFANYYAAHLGGPTITALTALATSSVLPWWQVNGYPRAFQLGDLSAAGLS